jgi:hypothetical protein
VGTMGRRLTGRQLAADGASRAPEDCWTYITRGKTPADVSMHRLRNLDHVHS